MENPVIQKETIYSQFYEEYYASAVNYVSWKTGNIHDAEDLVSDVFLYCYYHFDEYDSQKSSLHTWLYIVINSRLKNYYRDKKQTADVDELSNILPDEFTDMEKSVYLEQARLCISHALEELPERQRKIIIMKFFQDKSSAEIAKELEITDVNVRVLLSRTLKKLQQSCEVLKGGRDNG